MHKISHAVFGLSFSVIFPLSNDLFYGLSCLNRTLWKSSLWFSHPFNLFLLLDISPLCPPRSEKSDHSLNLSHTQSPMLVHPLLFLLYTPPLPWSACLCRWYHFPHNFLYSVLWEEHGKSGIFYPRMYKCMCREYGKIHRVKS